MQTIDLHGYSIEDGIEAADKFIDRSFTDKILSIGIITGNGPMFNKLRERLTSNSLIKEIKNDGILGNLYNGKLVLELETY